MRHDEKPQALGLGADGGVIEVLVSPAGVVATGEAWEMLQLAGDPT